MFGKVKDKLGEPKFQLGEKIFILTKYRHGGYCGYTDTIEGIKLGDATYIYEANHHREGDCGDNGHNTFFKTKEELLTTVKQLLNERAENDFNSIRINLKYE